MPTSPLTLLLLLFAAGVGAQVSLFDSLLVAGDTVSLSLDTDWKALIRH